VTVFRWLTVNQRQSGQVTWALLTGLWITPNRLTQGTRRFEITPNCLAQGTRGFLAYRAYPELSRLTGQLTPAVSILYNNELNI